MIWSSGVWALAAAAAAADDAALLMLQRGPSLRRRLHRPRGRRSRVSETYSSLGVRAHGEGWREVRAGNLTLAEGR